MLLPLLSLLISNADAGVFEGKTMRGDWPIRPTEQQLVLPRGWWQVGLGATTKSSLGVRGTYGLVQPYDQAVFQHRTATLSLSHGLSDRMTLYVSVPLVESSLVNDRGAFVSTTALGDSHSGFVFQPWVGGSDRMVAFQLDLKSPSGLEWPANATGGAAFTEGFLTGTGTTNLGAHVRGRFAPDPMFAVDANLGFTYKFAGVVGYVVQPDGFGNGWLKPGNELSAGLDATVAPIDQVSVSIGTDFAFTSLYYYGVSGEGTGKLETYWLGAEEEYEFAGGEVFTIQTDPAGVLLNVNGRVGWQVTNGFEVGANADLQLLAPDGRFFSYLGLEEFSPHPGTTLGVDTAVRW